MRTSFTQDEKKQLKALGCDLFKTDFRTGWARACLLIPTKWSATEVEFTKCDSIYVTRICYGPVCLASKGDTLRESLVNAVNSFMENPSSGLEGDRELIGKTLIK